MNRDEWIEQKEALVKHLVTAKRNAKTAKSQIEELDLTIAAYDKKIETFKTNQ